MKARNDITKTIETLITKYTDLKSLPFADCVLLVSGYSECLLFSRWLYIYAALNKKGFMPIVINYSEDRLVKDFILVVLAFNVPFAVLTDGKSFERNENKNPKILNGFELACKQFKSRSVADRLYRDLSVRY
jgi:predicted ATP-dependent endonuclease of OLD family